MSLYFSPSTLGFFSERAHGQRQVRVTVTNESGEAVIQWEANPDCTIPNDAVEITPQERDELLDGQARGRVISATNDGKPCLVDPAPLPLADLAARKRDEIEAARDDAIAGGFEHTFGDTTDIVQTRERDRENITRLAVSAQRKPDAIFPFRAASNTEYRLTADEMLALHDAEQAHVSEQYRRSWELKAQLEQALEAEDREGIEAVAWLPGA